QTKFEVLDEEFSIRYNRNPVEAIKTRLKSPRSIYGKMQKNALPITVENIREHLSDIAGIRIICSYPEDIYTLCDMFLRQDDVKLIRKKDYIANPKENGYRSLHLIVEVPIFLTDAKEYVRAEVQFRTIAMDFWASLEHKLKYKKDIPYADEVAAELKDCAEQIAFLDRRMEAVHRHIEELQK
ncbi:MAG: GTP pyrophosphokinase family protein, partial [Clostridia bacterium]|nr:GTP pyrophosphokinase family protein [Clostridia bacterium]